MRLLPTKTCRIIYALWIQNEPRRMTAQFILKAEVKGNDGSGNKIHPLTSPVVIS
jgi:hypothetical protein